MFYADGVHDDYNALQELLDKRGIVVLEKAGTYLVSKTLIIHSNTRFILSLGAKILVAPKACCAVIENEFFAGGGRDANIFIEGGIWDANCDNMGLDAVYEAKHRLDSPYSPDLFRGKLMRFAHVDNIHLKSLTVKDPVSYGIQIGDVRGFAVRDIYFDYNQHFGTTDGVHINGPAYDGVIENLYGTTNDDLVSLTTYDEEHAEVTKGEIANITIRDISAKNGYSAVRLLSGDGFELRDVTIDGIFGTYRHHAVVISNAVRREGKVWFDGITICRVHAAKSTEMLGEDCFTYWDNPIVLDKDPYIWFGYEAVCGNVVIRDVHRHVKETTNSPLLKIDENASFERLVIDNVCQTFENGATAPFYDIAGSIKTLIERDVDKNT